MSSSNHPLNTDLPALRILIVDDNRTNLQILQVFLKKLGHKTITAENGQEAVFRCLEHDPDVVLLDIMMPVMDGFEAARCIRAQPRDQWLPIIFLSALDRNENLVSGLEAGGDDFMSKPINFVVLEAKMRATQRMLLLQRQVTESLKRTKVISDNVLDAIITINVQATIVACNAACERIFGWTVPEMVGQNVSMLMHEPFKSEHDGYISRYVQGGPPNILGSGREATAVRKDGRIFPIELGVTEIRFDNERFFVGILRDISERKASEKKLSENAEQLQHYYDESEAENRLARSLIDRQMLRPGLNDPQLHFFITPAQNFSGDIIAAARARNGMLYAMLADATGHGLTAAISTLPLLTIFYDMAPSGPALSEMVGEINLKLGQAMPVGRFVAATIVCLDQKNLTGEIWIGGTPECLMIDAENRVLQRFYSQQLPLGIIETNSDMVQTVSFTWEGETQLVVYSDGLVEAENQTSTPFSETGLLLAMRGCPSHQRHTAVQNALADHLNGLPAHDDVSLLLIDCPITGE
jgi:PAS domain S-box-containing protein